MEAGDSESEVDDTARLRTRLIALDRSVDRAWLSSQLLRKQEEAEFHNRLEYRNDSDRSVSPQDDKEYSNRKYYTHTNAHGEYVERWLRTHVPGKVVLDFGCGDGALAIECARFGASLAIGLDISQDSIVTARANAAKAGTQRTTLFIQGDCESTGFPDEAVDIVLCSGMLHHLDCKIAFPEIYRILAPNGRLLAIEALKYNPIIALYRRLTPHLRTKWEARHILGLQELRYASCFFKIGEVRYWYLLSILSAHLPKFSSAFALFDRILTRIPGLQLMSWMFTFELLKSASTNQTYDGSRPRG